MTIVETMTQTADNGESNDNGVHAPAPEIVIPKTCKAGVVVNPGKDFVIVVEDVPVPEPGMFDPRLMAH
jgi:hypothetical protein